MTQNELERIQREYARRDKNNLEQHRYSVFNPANLFIVQTREQALFSLLRRQGIRDLAALRVLDIGCGAGGELLRWLGYGCTPSLCAGLDLASNRVAQARQRLPATTGVCVGDASHLPYLSDHFDLIFLFTVFSSILDENLRQQIAAETCRVIQPGGMIIWYDFWLNPTNPQTRGVRPAEIRRLFPKGQFSFQRVTLAPPVARAVAPVSRLFAALLDKLQIFNSHYLATIRPKG